MKFYELAKKLGFNSIELLKLIKKELKISIKSHMAEVPPDLLKKIEKKFGPKKTSSKKSSSKTGSKKTTKKSSSKTGSKSSAKKATKTTSTTVSSKSSTKKANTKTGTKTDAKKPTTASSKTSKSNTKKLSTKTDSKSSSKANAKKASSKTDSKSSTKTSSKSPTKASSKTGSKNLAKSTSTKSSSKVATKKSSSKTDTKKSSLKTDTKSTSTKSSSTPKAKKSGSKSSTKARSKTDTKKAGSKSFIKTSTKSLAKKASSKTDSKSSAKSPLVETKNILLRKSSAQKKSILIKRASPTKKSLSPSSPKTKSSSPSSSLSPSPSSALSPQSPSSPSSRSPRHIIIRRKEEIKEPVKSPPPSSPESEKPETTKETLSVPTSPSKSVRPDMVSVPSTNPLDEAFWSPEEEKAPVSPDKKQPKKPIAEKDVSAKFNPTDFRKREVIFQPRKKRTVSMEEFKSTQITTPKSHKRIIKVYGEMPIEKLCKLMGIKKQLLFKKLKAEGVPTKELKILDYETIALIIPSFGWTAKNTKKTEQEVLDKILPSPSEDKKGTPKAPVVTIMGHVDHGKTTLLDAIRKTKVAQGEAGGITQHIGAYSVFLEGKPISFIDTPGHAAFTAMRSRGAKATDIVVILVSAKDGVQAQTLEALNHAKAAKTPFVVAMSKTDLPGANIDTIKKQLAEHNVLSEDWGGDVSFVPISALKGEGIKELLEQIQLLAEMQELSYQKSVPAKGVVLESRKEKGFGCVVSLLIQDGVLNKGDNIVVGESFGRVRQMKNDQGQLVQEVCAGFPVEMIGLSDLPQAGDAFCVVKNEKEGKELILLRKTNKAGPEGQADLSPEELLEQLAQTQAQKRQLNLVLKADVAGSLEALISSLKEMVSDEVELKIIHSGAGAITESDILLAATVSGSVFGFNVRPDGKASKIAKEKSVPLYCYSVIYELLDQVKKSLLGLLKSHWIEEDQGRAEVRDIFHISKVGTVAGCYVTKGKLLRASYVRLVRDGRLVYEGALSSLKRFKEDVKQVGEGFECGLSLEKFNDIKPKDLIECYTKKEQTRTEL